MVFRNAAFMLSIPGRDLPDMLTHGRRYADICCAARSAFIKGLEMAFRLL
jgi:hypothetical protein